MRSMKNGKKIQTLMDVFTDKLMDLLIQKFSPGQRTYGFEYEFLSMQPLSPEDMERVYAVLPACGFTPDGPAFISASGMYITIEPGGQIEYCSPPLLKGDTQGFQQLTKMIQETNRTIRDRLGIEYIGTGYISDRVDAQMILKAQRYQNLHARMLRTGTRGREMMKGTASIHLHARILDMEDVIPLYKRFTELSLSDNFKMSADRRDIWNNTDPVRCGLPVKDPHRITRPKDLLYEIVRFAVMAEDIGENVPFPEKKDTRFEAFLYHMTTLFTDIRLNLKGPSWELRTLDSQPIDVFQKKWNTFINSIETMNARIY